MNPEQTQPAPQAQPQKPPIEAVKTGIGGVFSKFKPKKPLAPSSAGQNFAPEAAPPTGVAPTPKARLPKIPKKIILALVLLIILAISFTFIAKTLSNRRLSPLPSSSPSPTPSETPIVETPSQYADDGDVQRIKSSMLELDKNLNEAVFRDDRLRVPSLDWDVKFK